MLRQPSPGASESDGDSGEQQAEAAPRSPTPSSDEHQNVVVVVEPIDKTVFLTWNEFHEYLAEYQQRTFQVYSTRTVTPVSTRNRRIQERFEAQGKNAPPEDLLPEEMGTYSKAVVCTHHGQPRPRAAGLRTRKPSRAINCPARITLVLRKDPSCGQYFVYVTSHLARHNHELSGGIYRRHPMIRKVDDPDILRTVRALQKANVQPRKILEYVREHTDKEIVIRDVHNLLAQLRKKPTPPTRTPSTSVAVSAAAPSSAAVVAPSTVGLPERPPHFAGGVAPPSAAAAPPPSAAAAPPPSVAVAPPRLSQPTVAVSADRPLSFVIRNAGPARPQPQAQPSPPPAPARERPSQYGKFLAAFNIGKEIAELMAEMDDDRFAYCYAELRMFLRIIESGRVPVVTTGEAMEHTQTNCLTGLPNRSVQQQQTFHQVSSVPPSSASSGPSTAGNGPATNSSIAPSGPFSSG
ncbi:hypothetical protein PR003_g11281 [Phytophthora rubi]|uniref:FAR1 domain-containing protein n=1 Tax=Phytophthora rubi TaxID=129364 RepID=A0A6A4FB97_9STRA|nr:hypothetical protein PR001_g10787 [Phytophthora rubi]KAE9338893.1 hypothetical protein PR003_g11281 [Phytophthora rubi]